MYDYFFTGRKPSIKQVIAKVNEGIKQGNDYIEVSWGENLISLDRQLVNGKRAIWYGSGWIKGISGYDIAEDLNRKQTRNTLNLWNT